MSVLDVAIGQVANVLKQPFFRQWWDRITGGLMISAGALLARHGTS